MMQTSFTVGDIFEWIGYAIKVGIFASGVVFVLLSILGLSKPLWRFGMGVAWRKVFIVADGDSRDEIKNDLVRSGIFKEKNVKTKTKGEIGDLKGARLLILKYEYLEKEKVLEMVSQKAPDCGVLVYAKFRAIPDDVLDELNLFQHVSVVNFRGRLVNEALLLLLSTSFARKDVKGQGL